ncbi:MAG: hypothetical protein SVY10_10115 [Thermodesulfobacteriota bacterium]|nr:hypothetical protein [Thermodesulfobacteriota bacterium]
MKRVFCIAMAILFGCIFLERVHAIETGDIRIHGFVSQGYLESDKNNYLANDSSEGSFHFYEMGINVSTDLTDDLHMGMQFFSYDLGDLGNNKVILDWAFGDYRWRDWLGLRAGRLKIPYGFYNETRDVDSLRTNIILPQSVYNETMRDSTLGLQGIGIYGNIHLHSLGSLSYEFQVGTLSIEEDSSSAKLTNSMSGGLFEAESFSVGEIYVADSQWETPFEGLRIGGTFATMSSGSEVKTTEAIGPLPAGTSLDVNYPEITYTIFSIEQTWDNLILATEYLRRKLVSEVINISPKTTVEFEGYYVSASYRFTHWFELGTYYSIFYNNIDDKDGSDLEAQGLPDHGAWIKDFALTACFDMNEHWVFKIEGHLMDGTALVMEVDNPDGTDRDWFLFASKITYSF